MPANDALKSAEEAVSTLEKALRFRFALLFASFVLTMHCALTAYYHLRLPVLDWRPWSLEPMPQNSVKTGALIVFLAAYFFFISGVVPIIRGYWEMLLGSIRFLPGVYSLFPPRERTTYKEMYKRGKVKLSDSEQEALLSQNNFWTARNEAQAAHYKRETEEVELMANVSFSCLIVLLADYVFMGDESLTVTVVRWAQSYNGVTFAVLTTLIGLAAFMLFTPWWLAFAKWDRYDQWIKHPELANKRLKEIEKREEEERALQARIHANLRAPRRHEDD